MIVCTNCGSENQEDAKLCIKCSMPLNLDPKANSATHGLGNTDYEDGVPKWGSAKFNGTMNLLIEVLDNGQTFRFDANSVNEIIIGRKDPQSVADNTPSIDLTTSEGLSKGVSRRHATIVRRDGALHIVDNNSANGTYLNGQRLVSGQPRILRDGDDIRLGHLVMRVNFRAGQATP